jgi:hypothetical protein
MIVVVLWLRNSYTFDYDYYFGDKFRDDGATKTRLR